jgi:hypothetical protein
MHYGRQVGSNPFELLPVCGSGLYPRITTAKQIVTCERCKAWLVYEARQKSEEEMPKDAKTTVEDLRRTANELLARAAEIEREEKKNHPPEPPREAGNYFRVIVMFPRNRKTYTYLLLRTEHGGRWFTTGTHDDQKVFADWDAFMEWLNGPDVASHSNIVRLEDPTKTWGLAYTGPNRFASGPKFK